MMMYFMSLSIYLGDTETMGEIMKCSVHNEMYYAMKSCTIMR